MTVARPVPGSGARGTTDLARWRSALVVRWWLVAAGLLVGGFVGGLVAVASGSVYQASVLVAPGDVFSPSGSPVLSYLASPRGINDLVTSESSLAEAAAKAGVRVAQLRGHVTTQSIETGAGAVAARGTVLVKIGVRLPRVTGVAEAANALGAIVVRDTTSSYVHKSLGVIQAQIAGYLSQLNSLSMLIRQQNQALAKGSLDPISKLIVVGGVNNAELRQATISNSLTLAQQQLTLARSVEFTQVIGGPARAFKTTAVSGRNAVLVGALIGMLFGALTAIAVESRAPRPRPSS